jgi:hypothetical protein
VKTSIAFGLTIAFAVNTFAREVHTLAQWKPQHSGTVRYPSGEPAAGVQVTLYPGAVVSGHWGF